jgi:hypothetical protein
MRARWDAHWRSDCGRQEVCGELLRDFIALYVFDTRCAYFDAALDIDSTVSRSNGVPVNWSRSCPRSSNIWNNWGITRRLEDRDYHQDVGERRGVSPTCMRKKSRRPYGSTLAVLYPHKPEAPAKVLRWRFRLVSEDRARSFGICFLHSRDGQRNDDICRISLGRLMPPASATMTQFMGSHRVPIQSPPALFGNRIDLSGMWRCRNAPRRER